MSPQIPDETSQFTKQHDAPFLGISVRGMAFLLIAGTVCVMGAMDLTVKEPLYSLVLSVSAYYFGQSTRPIGGPIK
jgi:hypothetical protein